MLSGKRGAAALSVLSNTLLVSLKLAVGLAIGSVSVISEAIHSGIDLLAALMAFLAVRASSNPPDEEHRFGHGKMESLSGFVESLLIFVAALMIVNEASHKLMHGVERQNVDLGIAVMVISAVVNSFVSRRLLKVARETGSVALEADGWHLTTDVLTSAGVAIALVIVRITGLAVLDPLIAIGVALFICKAAFDITVRSMRDLLDASLPIEEQALIREALEGHSEEMVGYHKLRSRKAGSDRYLDVHLVVKPDVTVQESHDLCNHLEEHLESALGQASISIHVEPCHRDCRGCHQECAERRAVLS